jgi:hypothetical protein
MKNKHFLRICCALELTGRGVSVDFAVWRAPFALERPLGVGLADGGALDGGRDGVVRGHARRLCVSALGALLHAGAHSHQPHHAEEGHRHATLERVLTSTHSSTARCVLLYCQRPAAHH